MDKLMKFILTLTPEEAAAIVANFQEIIASLAEGRPPSQDDDAPTQ